MSDRPFEASYVISTSAGLCGLWQPEHFGHVTSLDSWEDDVSEESALERHIIAGAFVPLNVGGDGSFQVTIRTGARTSREARYTIVSSQPYLLISRGLVALGGLENVGSYAGGAEEVSFTAGRYALVIHLIDWKAEPGSVADGGGPTESALPDFVVEVAPVTGLETAFRTKLETFDRP